jgi:histidinol-phosphatase (PHP family)
MWSNYHTHTFYCDGKASIEETLKRASDERMMSLGVSSHAPLPFDCKWCMKGEDFAAYCQEIDRLRTTTSTQLYCGLEVDYIPGVISSHTFREQVDYTIGSIHFVEQFRDGRRWEIDGTHAFFLEGLADIFQHDIRAAVTRYYELTREMVTHATPDIVGHLDKIKMQNRPDALFQETDAWYEDEILKTLDAIARNGCILEINTRGIYQRKTTTTYPSPWVLEIARKKNIPITISSDAHHPDDLTNTFEETATMLLQIGFKKICVLNNGVWSPFEFSSHGIITT